MVELVDIPSRTKERLDEIGSTDLVIALLVPGSGKELPGLIESIRESLNKLYNHVRAVVVHDGDPAAIATPESITTLALPGVAPDRPDDPARALSDSYQAVFSLADRLGARGAVVIVSGLESAAATPLYGLARPVVELDFDLVTPCYAHGKFEGLLNSGIVAPLTRALFGKRLQHPLGPDFAFSGRLIKRFLEHAAAARTRTHPRSIASLAVDAACDGLEICQANLGPRKYRPTDWANQSSVLASVLAPLFSEAEQHAPYWQRIRESQTVATFGDEAHAIGDGEPLDPARMIESFQLGHRDLREIWSAVLPPATLFELSRLARIPTDQFRLPDRLWARILYDFVLGYRLRSINPDHLLRAMTPLYLAWVASYALESAEGKWMEDRFEKLSLAFEAAKPYMLSRWRWPDRFQP